MNKVMKRLSGVVAMVLLLSGVFALGGCGWFNSENWRRNPPPSRYRYSECGAWVYRKYDRDRQPILDDYGEQVIYLVSVLDEYLHNVVDERNFLIVPTEVDGYRVVRLGDESSRVLFTPRYFHTGEGRVNRIVIPEGLFVAETFWTHRLTNYIEFLSETPSFVVLGGSGLTLIVPDGSRERYISHSSTVRRLLELEPPRIIVVEKTQFYDTQNNND